MNFLKKTLFMFVVIILLVATVACTSVTTSNDPAQAIDAGSTIADFDLPPGYTSEFSSSMLGYIIVTYRGQNASSHLYLIQSEKESDEEDLARMLTEMVPGWSDANTRMTVIENRPVKIRDQETTLILSDAINSEGESYRQLTVAFEGKEGPALLVFSESLDAWDQAATDKFLDSIR
jgi:hypothetical protein